jgi:hypothetical protein
MNFGGQRVAKPALWLARLLLHMDGMKSFVCRLATGVGIVLMATSGARGDGTSSAGIVVKGPLAGLNQAAAKVGFKDTMPARLCGLLWPDYATTNRCEIKKVSMVGTDDGEKQVMIVRMDNRDLIFARFTETKPHDDSKIRHEYYFRATSAGHLALALQVTFQFRITDTDTDIIKDMTLQTYSDLPGDPRAQPVTPEIKAQFEAEKKLWLSQQKKLKKQEQDQDK